MSVLDIRLLYPRPSVQRQVTTMGKDQPQRSSNADFMVSVETAMHTIKDLNVLNDYMENQKLLGSSCNGIEKLQEDWGKQRHI